MNERLRAREMESTEKARAMGLVVARTAHEIREALVVGDLEGIKKKVAFERTMLNLPSELRGLNLEMTGDNWLWRDPKTEQEEAVMPGIAASISLVETDEKGDIISCAATIIDRWNNEAVIAGKEGVFVYREGNLQKVKTIDPAYLYQPPQVNLFGQKRTDYWTNMDSVIGEMNRKFRTMNDMGLYYVLRSLFENFRDGRIIPVNGVLIEPNNKFKNEVPAFIAKRLKDTVAPNEIQVRDMRMNDVYDDGHYRKSGGEYDSVGYVIATTSAACEAVMSAFRNAVLGNPVFRQPSDDPRFARLRQELQNWKK